MPEDSLFLEVLDSDGAAEAAEYQLLDNQNEEKITKATLVKEELRCAIQSRRLAAGQGELTLEEFKKPQKKLPVTDEEKKRALTRRVQNREAAQRFRQKQKDRAGYLSEKIKRLEKSSTQMLSDIKQLRIEREGLKKMLLDHMAVCTNTITISDTVYSNLEHYLQLNMNPSTSCDDASATPNQCPNTSDSTSSVFFPEDFKYNPSDPLMYGNLLQGFEAHTLEMIQGEGSLMQDLIDAPEMAQEMVIGDADLSDSLSEYSDDLRNDSCSTFETKSNYSSVSSDYFGEATDLTSTIAQTFSRVHVIPLCSQTLGIEYMTDDYMTNEIHLLDNNIS